MSRPAAPVTPQDAREKARAVLQRHHRGWTLEGADQPIWRLPLHPPTEKQALASGAAARDQVDAWRRTTLPEGMQVQWEMRSWPSLGPQTLPTRLIADTPQALAAWVGGSVAEEQSRFARRVARLRELAADLARRRESEADGGVGAEAGGVVGAEAGGGRTGAGAGSTGAGAGSAGAGSTGAGPDSAGAGAGSAGALRAAIRAHAQRLTDLPEATFTQVIEALVWLHAHPVSGLRPRQLPIRGVDSKWFGTHQALLEALMSALRPEAPHLGVVRGESIARLHILDPALRPGGVRDLQLPMTQASPLYPRCGAPRRVLIVENRETLLCLPDAPGVVAIGGTGFDPTMAAALPWLRDVPITYWGDLDSHGLAILHRFRNHLPQITSVLMDAATLDAFADLTVPEPAPSRADLPLLTSSEREALAALRRGGDLRLEQERIPWDHALAALAPVLGARC